MRSCHSTEEESVRTPFYLESIEVIGCKVRVRPKKWYRPIERVKRWLYLHGIGHPYAWAFREACRCAGNGCHEDCADCGEGCEDGDETIDG